jgi:hypothetical protein
MDHSFWNCIAVLWRDLQWSTKKDGRIDGYSLDSSTFQFQVVIFNTLKNKMGGEMERIS